MLDAYFISAIGVAGRGRTGEGCGLRNQVRKGYGICEIQGIGEREEIKTLFYSFGNSDRLEGEHNDMVILMMLIVRVSTH